MTIKILSQAPVQPEMPGDFELIERKGRGHPDTLADRLADILSRTYCQIAKREFGTILRHQFDKLTLMGGRCEVNFGGGHISSPIRLLLNGRVTSKVGDKAIWFRDALIDASQQFLQSELRNFDFAANCRVIFETSSARTRGVKIGPRPGASAVHYRFNPRTLKDIPEYERPLANDTSLGCAWAPHSDLEKLVLDIERNLTSDQSRVEHPWLGSDVKVMAVRISKCVEITVSAPQICTHVNSIHQYHANSETLKALIQQIAGAYKCFSKITLTLNPGDNADEELLYMKFTGSCIESGDEGQVGRGNRIGGIIAPCRPFTMEGIAGKNPAYHAGKLYSAAAWDIANAIWEEVRIPSEVYIASQMDRPLDDPWIAIVRCFGGTSREVRQIRTIVEGTLSDIRGITVKLLAGYYPLA